MTAIFQKKNLAPNKRICLRLRELRKKKGVSLEMLAKRTNIGEENLRAIESCDFDKLPEGIVYKKNFIKRYLKALGVDSRPFIRQLVEEEIDYMQPEKMSVHPRKYAQALRFSNLPTVFRYLIATIVILGLIGYLGMQVKNILEPPHLTLISPYNGYVSNEPTVLVKGQTEKEVNVSINGRLIVNNEKGQFNESIDLIPGLNTIIVTAEKKHGKKTTETRYVVLKEIKTR